MLNVNYYIMCFGDAAAYRVYVYIFYPLQGGRSTAYCTRWEVFVNTHFATTYTHTHDMLPHHRNI